MANISSVGSISYESTSEDLAQKLLVFLKLVDADEPYYNLLFNPTIEGNLITGEGASGRWSYATNLENAFMTPERWFSWELEGKEAEKKAWADVVELLKKGETIDVDWSEEESGCDLYGDGCGRIQWLETLQKVDFSYDFTDDDEARERDQHDQEDWDDDESDEA
jgi:hypothetical protein